MDSTTTLEELRRRVTGAAKAMSKLGLARMTSGNVSAREPRTGLIAITPSGFPYDLLKPEDMVLMDAGGNVEEGKHEPSSETPMHTLIYRSNPAVNGIVHTHSVYATVFAVLNRELPAVTVPLASLGPIPVAPFQPPGSRELAQEVVLRLSQCPGAVLMQNHGAVCAAANVESALETAVYLEEGAQIALLVLMAGGLKPGQGTPPIRPNHYFTG